MRVTHDMETNRGEIERALRSLGLVIGRDKGRSFERLEEASTLLARALTTAPSEDGRILPDAASVTRDEAVEYVIHHLRLAAMFFECTPDDRGAQIHEEIGRLLRLRGGLSEHVGQAMSAFVETLDTYYEGLRSVDEVIR